MIQIRELFQSTFAKNVTMISVSTAFAQLLSALLSPLITRIYSPEEYGVLTLYSSILGLTVIIASLRYEWGIPIADNDEKAINIVGLCFFVLFIYVLILFTTIYFFKDFIVFFLDAKDLYNYLYFLPIGVLLAGSYQIFLQWAYRNKDFRSITKTNISQSLTGNGAKIGLGLLGIGSLGLILGQILQQCAGIGTLSRPIIRNRKNLLKKLNKGEVLWCISRYKNFPIFSAPSQLLNTAGIQLPVIFISSIYGNQALGLYGLANSVVNIPMVLLGHSVTDVLYAEAASVGKSNPLRIKYLYNKLFKNMVFVGLIPLLILLFFSPFLFSFVFGPKWYEAGLYARILAFLVFVRFIFTPISRIFFILERQKQAFMLDLFRVVLVLIVFRISALFSFSSYYAVGLYSTAMSVVYLATYLFAQKMLNEEIKKQQAVGAV